MDEDVKERAKEIARERGTSLSALVEGYFRLLSGESASGGSDESEAALTPRLKKVHEQIGPPPDDAPFDAPRGDWTEDEQQFIKTATEKHA
jgi:hypothetical protein